MKGGAKMRISLGYLVSLYFSSFSSLLRKLSVSLIAESHASSPAGINRRYKEVAVGEILYAAATWQCRNKDSIVWVDDSSIILPIHQIIL